MSKLVILSPHFDDGVLSCGGQIWHALQQGRAARVLSIFAGPPVGEVPPFAQVQHAMWGDPPDANRLRRAEDVVAYARLGCFDLHHLDAPDAVYRVDAEGNPLYGSEEAIFGPIHPKEADYARLLTNTICSYLSTDDHVLAPLGVGHHVDHQLVYLIGTLLLEDGYSVAFYEELPYVEWDGAVEQTLANKPSWEMNIILLSSSAITTKIEAMAYYRSQIPVLYGNEASMAHRIRTVARQAATDTQNETASTYAERIWWPSS